MKKEILGTHWRHCCSNAESFPTKTAAKPKLSIKRVIKGTKRRHKSLLASKIDKEPAKKKNKEAIMKKDFI